jgi:hypothetical protein
VPEVAAPSEVKDDAEGLKREAEKEVDVGERKKRKWEEEKDSSTNDSSKVAVRIMLLYSETCIRRNRMGPKIFFTLDKFPHYTK